MNQPFGKDVLDGIGARHLVLVLRVDQLDAEVLVCVQAADFLRHRQARGFVLDQQVIDLELAGGVGDALDQLVQLVTGLPAIHQHDLGDIVVIAVNAPHCHGREVVLFLRGVGGVHCGDDELHLRECVFVPILPPVTLQDTAALGLRTLLELACSTEWAKLAFEPVHAHLIVTLWGQKLSVLRPGI